MNLNEHESNNFCDCCRDELNLEKLCVKKIKACDICVKNLQIKEELCVPLMSAPEVCAENMMAKRASINDACIPILNAADVCAQNINANNIGVANLVANNVCIPGKLSAADFVQCGKYRATATFSSTTNYTLDTDVNFDTVIDDPNNNVLMAPTRYIAPIDGYYILTYKMNVFNLVSSNGPILGVPVANPQVFVNGIVSREAIFSFLSFNAEQKSVLTSIVILKAGDIVTFRYKVLTLDAVAGLVSVIGTMDVFGDGTAVNTSQFSIHLLSIDCGPNGVEVPCSPVIPCEPCVPMQCTPCVPSTSNPNGCCDMSNG